jgi:hypothetical protein
MSGAFIHFEDEEVVKPAFNEVWESIRLVESVRLSLSRREWIFILVLCLCLLLFLLYVLVYLLRRSRYIPMGRYRSAKTNLDRRSSCVSCKRAV